MPKIKVEIEVPEKYCRRNPYCPMCKDAFMGITRCALFGVVLEKEFIDDGYYSKRCDECLQAEIQDADK